MSDKKQAKNKDKVKVAIRYGVALPERTLLDLLRLDCAGSILRLSNEIVNSTPGHVFAKMKELEEVFNVTSTVLDMIQEAWKDDIQGYSEKKKLPQGGKPPKVVKGKNGLSETEQRKIRSLRKQGLSIKKIGKEIHRSEKIVADFVRNLPKK